MQDHVCFVIWTEMHSDSPIRTHPVVREPYDMWPSQYLFVVPVDLIQLEIVTWQHANMRPMLTDIIRYSIYNPQMPSEFISNPNFQEAETRSSLQDIVQQLVVNRAHQDTVGGKVSQTLYIMKSGTNRFCSIVFFEIVKLMAVLRTDISATRQLGYIISLTIMRIDVFSVDKVFCPSISGKFCNIISPQLPQFA